MYLLGVLRNGISGNCRTQILGPILCYVFRIEDWRRRFKVLQRKFVAWVGVCVCHFEWLTVRAYHQTMWMSGLWGCIVCIISVHFTLEQKCLSFSCSIQIGMVSWFFMAWMSTWNNEDWLLNKFLKRAAIVFWIYNMQ